MPSIDYPPQWDELPNRERKRKIRELKKQKQNKAGRVKKARNIGVVTAVVVLLAAGYTLLSQKSPEEITFREEVKQISLEGKVEEFEMEGRGHVAPATDVEYKTNPPTSGDHYADPADWGVYDKELADEAVVHSLEHGGIWIAYKDISDKDKAILEQIGKDNSQSVVVSPRSANDVKVAVVSWKRMMKLEAADRALIQKYIDTYKNQSPEKLAR